MPKGFRELGLGMRMRNWGFVKSLGFFFAFELGPKNKPDNHKFPKRHEKPSQFIIIYLQKTKTKKTIFVIQKSKRVFNRQTDELKLGI